MLDSLEIELFLLFEPLKELHSDQVVAKGVLDEKNPGWVLHFNMGGIDREIKEEKVTQLSEYSAKEETIIVSFPIFSQVNF